MIAISFPMDCNTAFFDTSVPFLLKPVSEAVVVSRTHVEFMLLCGESGMSPVIILC